MGQRRGTEEGDGVSFIKDPNTAENIDTHGAGGLMTYVTITDQQKDAALMLLKRHGALDLADMIGVGQ